ncbi:GNAT family N-acetyltransferase [Hyphomonas johnsonii]|uniref:N-acetyltransferase GCN5 n=1 Tax=Hyphomonas johnsonii MHS-2 TaxID=1280950 RepID=A0A059FTC7_9PROT|nr:GNAT family N-acetyltransferase [Hyphomonas johnsonii]KCZ93930.1 N-acetyltransferase GCN5 [Hyphomonas johnsonii MHS-2]
MTQAKYLHIRPARADDSAALIAILYSTFQSTWRPAITPAAAGAYARENRPADYVGRCGLEFRVAERAGEVIGLVHWRNDFIHALHVHSAHARTGAGAALMDLAEAEIAHAGFPSARLETDTFNTASQAFYAGRGYVEAGRYPDAEWDSGLTTLLLEKRLG